MVGAINGISLHIPFSTVESSCVGWGIALVIGKGVAEEIAVGTPASMEGCLVSLVGDLTEQALRNTRKMVRIRRFFI
jgi:hypothetical protein